MASEAAIETFAASSGSWPFSKSRRPAPHGPRDLGEACKSPLKTRQKHDGGLGLHPARGDAEVRLGRALVFPLLRAPGRDARVPPPFFFTFSNFFLS